MNLSSSSSSSFLPLEIPPENPFQINKKDIHGKIFSLSNTHHYFIHFAIILCLSKGYRLLVQDENSILTDKIFETLRGAKVAFHKLYSYRQYGNGCKPRWSHLYHPERQWLIDRFNHVGTQINKG